MNQVNLGSILLHAERGRKKNPALANYIDGAVRLIRAGHISRAEDGDFIVKSEANPEHEYHVNGTCQCPSYTGIHPTTGKPLTTVAPDGWCKHRLAMALLIRDETFHNQLELEIARAKRLVEAQRVLVHNAQHAYEQTVEDLAKLLEQHIAELCQGPQEQPA